MSGIELRGNPQENMEFMTIYIFLQFLVYFLGNQVVIFNSKEGIF